MAQPAVELSDVSLRFGRRWSLVRLSFALPEGRAVLLTGDNGAGKTTLLKVIATVLGPTRGRVRLFGADAREERESVRRRLSLVTHSNHLYDNLTARENLQLVADFTGRDRGAVEGLLERVALAPHAERSVGVFSAGMKRRLCMARLLLCEPELALLDEPFGQLDPAGVAAMESVMGELVRRGTTLLVATHDHPRGRALCDLHLHLDRGSQRGELEAIAA